MKKTASISRRDEKWKTKMMDWELYPSRIGLRAQKRWNCRNSVRIEFDVILDKVKYFMV